MISLFRPKHIDSKRALFFDRDNTLNSDAGYTYKVEDLQLLPGARQILQWGREAGYSICLITNQSWIERGYYTESDALAFIAALEIETWVVFDAICICPHISASNCSCRKPKPGMIEACINHYNLDPNESFFIGDREDDMKAALSAGVQWLCVWSVQGDSFRSFSSLEDIQEYLESYPLAFRD